MAYGKNKGLNKGKKGAKKKVLDPFLRKIWYDIKAPAYFRGRANRAGRTCVTKTTGTRIETEGLKGRVAEFCLADLNGPDSEADGHKKIKLKVLETQGKACLTDFHSMHYTRDEMCKMVKKKHTLVEAVADCKTTDGYVIRLFCLAQTQRSDQQTRNFCYAQSAQIRRMRKKMVSVMQEEVAQGQLRDCVKALNAGDIELRMKKATARIYPLDPVKIIKAKMLKEPKFDIIKLMEVHEGREDDGAIVVDESADAQNTLTAETK